MNLWETQNHFIHRAAAVEDIHDSRPKELLVFIYKQLRLNIQYL